MRKLDSPKKRLLPPGAAATDGLDTTAGVPGDDGPVDTAACDSPGGLGGTVGDTGLVLVSAMLPADLAVGGWPLSDTLDPSFTLDWRDFRGYLPHG